jgi:hypothetical protein
MKIHLIGCGGVGSYAAPVLAKLGKPSELLLVDGDKLESKNLDRQLFREDQLGMFKAEALARLYGCGYENRWFSTGVMEIDMDDWLLVAVDNHPARLDALRQCDLSGCRAIFAANETYSAEAYFYQPDWRNTALDPRSYYPEIITSHAGDPRAAAIGCTGESQVANRQLATANFMAAALMLQLLTIWKIKSPELEAEAIPHLPFKLVSNLTRLETFRVKDVLT